MFSSMLQIGVQSLDQQFKVSLKVVLPSQENPVMDRHVRINLTIFRTFPDYWYPSLVVFDRVFNLQDADFGSYRVRTYNKQEGICCFNATIDIS